MDAREFLDLLFPGLGLNRLPEGDINLAVAWRLVEERLTPITARLIDDLIEDGVAQGKLLPSEKDWARETFHGNGAIKMLETFIARRRRCPRSCPGYRGIVGRWLK